MIQSAGEAVIVGDGGNKVGVLGASFAGVGVLVAVFVVFAGVVVLLLYASAASSFFDFFLGLPRGLESASERDGDEGSRLLLLLFMLLLLLVSESFRFLSLASRASLVDSSNSMRFSCAHRLA